MKVVIVGGVAGGASAAARIRRLDEHAQIIMIERSGYVSYANCGLPYYVGGVMACAALIGKAAKKKLDKKVLAVVGAAAFVGAILAVILIARTPMPL